MYMSIRIITGINNEYYNANIECVDQTTITQKFATFAYFTGLIKLCFKSRY